MKKIRVRGKSLESAMPQYLVPNEFFDIKVLEENENNLSLTGTLTVGTAAATTLGVSGVATTTSLNVTGTLGLFGETPIGQQGIETEALLDITSDAPETANYTPVVTDTDPYGFATEDDVLTVLAVIKNLQDRINELEAALQAYGILS